MLFRSLGNQRQGELLVDDWARRDFRRIVELARTADAFQDMPFSLPFTYQALDAAFPGSKFVLTVRDSPRDWYDSMIRFHSRIVGKSMPPRPDELKAFNYIEPGRLWKNHQLVYGITEETLYDRELYMRHYAVHLINVIDYFRFRPGQFLLVNLREPDAMRRLCSFLGVDFTGQAMPHLNRTLG